jgi:hypothetical protein
LLILIAGYIKNKLQPASNAVVEMRQHRKVHEFFGNFFFSSKTLNRLLSAVVTLGGAGYV